MHIKKYGVVLLLVGVSLTVGALLARYTNLTQEVKTSFKAKLKDDFLDQVTPMQQTKKKDSKVIKFSFALISDVHNNVEGLNLFVSQSNKEDLQFVVGVGDYTNVGTPTELSQIKKSLDNLNAPLYMLPGDHDLWNGRDKTQDPLSDYAAVFGDSPELIVFQGVTFIFIDNADIYNGVNPEKLEAALSNLTQATTSTIIIVSHKAIYHPLTIHRMGFIQEDEIEAVSSQAKRIVGNVTSLTGKNIYMIHGDLHSSSSYRGPNDNILNYTIGALTREKNFQTPRFAIGEVYEDNSLEIRDVPIK